MLKIWRKDKIRFPVIRKLNQSNKTIKVIEWKIETDILEELGLL